MKKRRKTNLFLSIPKGSIIDLLHIVEIAVNDICRECFILCLMRVVQEVRGIWGMKNDGTSGRPEMRRVSEIRWPEDFEHITHLLLEPSDWG